MSERQNTRVLVNKRPVGLPKPDDFRLDTVPVSSPADDEMLLKTIWLSLDPYMRGRMNDETSYGKPITGGVVSQVVESNIAAFETGDFVTGIYGWQQYAIARPGDVRFFKIDPSLAPLSTAIGAAGMPGQTAYYGLLKVGKPKPGETVVVSAASGAVGSVVGQIAKFEGCRAVGVAGGEAKCRHVVEDLGFDACVDYKAGSLDAELAAACPDGIDVYFENVGGDVLLAVSKLLNEGARVPICGYISAYNATSQDEVTPPAEILDALDSHPLHRFFGVTEWLDEFEESARYLGGLIRDGKLKYRETVVEGIENAPAAFLMLFSGQNLGKLLIKVAEPQ
ncbi:MAG: NADP-dependent oxidoreductase [Pseudomonadales bacterium]|jgi:hypothetical protein|nr:NADP-dependent oxidoreductase [Pseudomonadales bacterium]MDP7359128.1 NADP-dependent oxidoreductase [Pseudomonadales bacterium]MDP7594621.1 NADP-dependent oxidoreductase [Pseudomonadales bacterium]HJN52301.1 NADP-dependent oxidoreductase [Pseudomonadales bacterium]|tara:strand:- start:2093 stop:3103 length:1011 start_codon:yes stop_codon:yes gene_type:complete